MAESLESLLRENKKLSNNLRTLQGERMRITNSLMSSSESISDKERRKLGQEGERLERAISKTLQLLRANDQKLLHVK